MVDGRFWRKIFYMQTENTRRPDSQGDARMANRETGAREDRAGRFEPGFVAAGGKVAAMSGGLLGGGEMRKNIRPNDLQIHQPSFWYFARLLCIRVQSEPLGNSLRTYLAKPSNFAWPAKIGNDFLVIHAVIKACFTRKSKHSFNADM